MQSRVVIIFFFYQVLNNVMTITKQVSLVPSPQSPRTFSLLEGGVWERDYKQQVCSDVTTITKNTQLESSGTW